MLRPRARRASAAPVSRIALWGALLGAACGGKTQIFTGSSDASGGSGLLGGSAGNNEPNGGTPSLGGSGSSRGGSAGSANGGRGGRTGVGGRAMGGSSGAATGGASAASGEGGEGATSIVESFALGTKHSCVVSNHRVARCWGDNDDGQIGLGRRDVVGDDELPAEVPDVELGGTVVALSAGWFHTCALLEQGRVRCFGDNSGGQLGYANTENVGDDETPASAGDVNVGGRVVSLAAGASHTCALLETGAVRCWGASDRGQLGYGNTESIGDDETPATAGEVDVGGRVVAIRAGGYFTCALLDTRRVRCWGSAWLGCLGHGNTNDIGDDETPATAGDVELGGDVESIGLGVQHACALLVDGALRCWGGGFYGESGHGNTQIVGDDEVPASVPPLDVGGTVTELATGAHHTCVLLDSGKVRCWGEGVYGQLGYANMRRIGDDEVPSTAGDVDLGGVAVRVATGAIHTCALLDSDAVRCWGYAERGELGYGSTNNVGDDETPASMGDVSVFPGE